MLTKQDNEVTYSGKQVIKAGEYFLLSDVEDNCENLDWAMSVLSWWRFQHEHSLEMAFTILKTASIKYDKNSIFAKRLKRQPSVVSKLNRFPKMKLKNMQDIGGCRAIVSNQKKLFQIVRELKKKEQFRTIDNRIRFKDYIKSPKQDGYRGYHLIGSFESGAGKSKSIELQLRTRIQHNWATTLEIVDLFTGQALKLDSGEESWKQFFLLVSEHFALMDSIHLFDSKGIKDQVPEYDKKLSDIPKLVESGREIRKLNASLGIVKNLEAFSNSLRVLDHHISETKITGYVLLNIDTKNLQIKLTNFKEEQTSEAEKNYLDEERKSSGKKDHVVALVSTTAIGGIKEAYPNYFADSSNFLKYLQIILAAQEYRRPNFLQRIIQRTGIKSHAPN